MADNRYLGCGMKFPPEVNPGTGRFVTVEGTDSVKESIYIILKTQKGERFLLPEFGSSLMSYAFMTPTKTTLELMKYDIRTMLLEQEPRLSDVQVDVDPVVQNGCLMVSIQYQIQGSYTKDSMVFPFYLDGAQKEAYDETAGYPAGSQKP
jgi:phage baseplate assembly protein W